MNLSALNTGLNQASANNTPEVSTPGNTPLRLPAGALSGEDFAAFLRNQVRALKNSQRPDIAAAPVPSNLPPTERSAATPERKEPTVAENRSNKFKSQDKQAARHDGAQAAAQDDQAVHKELSQADDFVVRIENAPDTSEQEAGQPSSSGLLAVSAPTDATLEQTSAAEEIEGDATSDLATAAELTTIPLSPSINIITTVQTAPDDQSLTDFALAMGLDPHQVQALFGSAGTSVATNNVSTQQMLAMNSLPTVAAPSVSMDAIQFTASMPAQVLTNVAVSTADFQALKAEQPVDSEAILANAAKTLDMLNMQIATAQATSASPVSYTPPISTLAVLSMMDSQLRPEDIEALKNEFDAVSAVDLGGSENGLASGHQTSSNTYSAQAASKAAAAFANQPDMAQTFDKLSEKLATELAGRMHEKLNAGEWKMKFALKPASLGLVDVQLEMRDGKLTAQFNADTNLTQELIQSGSQRLKEALGQLGMNNASVLVGQGQGQQQGQASNSSNPSRQGDDNRVKLADESGAEPNVRTKPRHSNSLQFDNYA
jgi:flagellar hook-length control protein FliK